MNTKIYHKELRRILREVNKLAKCNLRVTGKLKSITLKDSSYNTANSTKERVSGEATVIMTIY